MLTMSCFSSLIANSWSVPGEELNNTLDFVCWLTLIRFADLQDLLPDNTENDIDGTGALVTPDPNPDWCWSADKFPVVKSLLLNLVQDHPSILPTAFFEAMDLVRTIFTEGSSEAAALIRDVEGDVEVVLITSFFLVIRAFYDPSFTAADFNAATDSRYAGFVQPSPWRSTVEEFLDLDDEEQTDSAGLERARLAMLNELLPDIEYFQAFMNENLEAPLTAVYLGPAPMLSRDSLDDEYAFYEDSELVDEDEEEVDDVEEGVLSLTAMAEEIMLLSRIASTASDQVADHGHEDPVRGSQSSSPAVSGLHSAPTPVVDVPAPPKRVRATEYPFPRMPTPVVASAPSVDVPTPVIQPAPPKRIRATEYPFPKMPTPIVAAAPAVMVQPPVVEETAATPVSPVPSFTLPHPLSTMQSLAAILVNDPSDWNGQLAEMRLLMDNVHAAIRYASYREDREEADETLSESPSVSVSIAISMQEPMSTAADVELLGVPHPSVNSIASSMVQIEVVSPTPIIPRAVGVPDWVAEASQPAMRNGSDTPLFELPELPSRSTTSTDAATLVGSVSFAVKGKPSFAATTSSATGSSADWLSMYRRTPFPVHSVLTTASIESENSGWLADRSAPSSPDFAPNVTRPVSVKGSRFQCKLSAFICKLRVPGNRSSTKETAASDPSPPVLPPSGFPSGFTLVPVAVPSFPSSPSSYVSPDSPERLMEYGVLVPVLALTEVEVAKDKRQWPSPSKWFGRRRSGEKVQKAA